MQSEPGREATTTDVANQLGAWLTEMGPHYDSPNDAVIRPGGNAHVVVSRLVSPAHLRGTPLRAHRSGAIMKPSGCNPGHARDRWMKQEAPYDRRRD